METQVIVVIGAGGIGIAIARRQGFGKHILLADFNQELLEKAGKELEAASYKVTTQPVDVSSRDSVAALADAATKLGSVFQVINTAGLSPNMASPARILEVDLYGSAVVFEEFGRVIAHGGAGLVVSSMAGHMTAPLPPDQEHALAFTPADELLMLPFLSADAVTDPGQAYIISKKGNHLRVQAESLNWGKRGARVNSISPGIILTPLALHELNSPIGDMYRALIEASPAKRMASPDEVAVACSYLLGPDAAFITGSDLLIDGGVIASMLARRVPSPK